jgi:hypothetical protein
MTRRSLLLIVTTLLATGCASSPTEPASGTCCAYGTTISDRIFFGRDIQGTDSVTEAAWTQFVTEVVATSFPNEGWTVFRAEGHWYEPATGLIRESSFVLEKVHVLNARADSLMMHISRSYITRFRQSAVLRVKTPASMELIEK